MSLFHKPALGLDISDRSVEAVLVVREGDRCVAASYGRITLTPGLVQDGEILDAKALGQAVRKLLLDKMTPPLPKGVDRVAFALPESQVYMHIFEVPRLADERELGASLALEADGYFPFPHEQMAASYTIIAQRPDKKDIYYAAVRKSVLDAYRQFFSSIGLTPLSIEAESTAIARAALDKEEKDPVVLVDVGARVVDISIFDRNGIHFSETLEHAGDAFTQALAKADGLPPEQAETAKQERGLPDDPQSKGDRALRAATDAMLTGVEEAIAYYEEKSHRAVNKILFCGGSALMPGLLAHAAARLNALGTDRVIALVDPWKSARPSEALERLGIRTRSALIATAVGLGLRGQKVKKFEEINFLNAAAGPRGHLVPMAVPVSKGKSSAAALSAAGQAGDGRKRVLRVLKIVGGVLFGLAVAASLWAVGRYVMAWLKPPPPKYAAAPDAQTMLQVQGEAVMGESFSADTKTLTGAPLSYEVSVSKKFSHAAQQGVGKASGTIEIVNASSSARALVATTRFLSSSGVLFRLDAAAAIPAGGRVSARITADAEGAQGDVPAGKFTIPGLPASQQTQIYGESKEAMRGGVTSVGTPFTDEERAQAAEELADEAKAAAAAKAVEQTGEGQLLPEGLLSVGALEIKGMPAVGAPTGDYAPSAVVKVKAFALMEAEIDKLLRQELAKKLENPDDAEAYDFGNLAVTVVSFDSEAGTASFTLAATAVRD